jgi:hypothetical protein
VATTAGRPKLRYATVGWLLVVLAVGTVVLIRGATRYNPYLKNLRAVEPTPSVTCWSASVLRPIGSVPRAGAVTSPDM